MNSVLNRLSSDGYSIKPTHSGYMVSKEDFDLEITLADGQLVDLSPEVLLDLEPDQYPWETNTLSWETLPTIVWKYFDMVDCLRARKEFLEHCAHRFGGGKENLRYSDETILIDTPVPCLKLRLLWEVKFCGLHRQSQISVMPVTSAALTPEDAATLASVEPVFKILAARFGPTCALDIIMNRLKKQRL